MAKKPKLKYVVEIIVETDVKVTKRAVRDGVNAHCWPDIPLAKDGADVFAVARVRNVRTA